MIEAKHIQQLCKVTEACKKIPLCSNVGFQDELKKHYDIIKVIGAGGESVAYKVLDKETEQQYALIVNKELKQKMELDREQSFIQKMIHNQDINCHQAKIFNYFWVSSKNLGKCKVTGKERKLIDPFKDRASSDILTRHYDNDSSAETFRHRAYLIELGICDLSSERYDEITDDKKPIKQKTELKGNREIDKLIRYISNLSFSAAGILDSDFKLRNHILIPSNLCYYKSKKMGDFDYWAYHICKNLTFWVPRQEYVVKRIDFIDWKLGKEEKLNRSNCLEYLSRAFRGNDILNLLMAKPAHGSILDIYPNKNYQERDTLINNEYFNKAKAAIKIQSLFRGYRIRKAYKVWTEEPDDIEVYCDKSKFKKHMDDIKQAKLVLKL